MAVEGEGEMEFGSEFPAHYKVMLDKLNEQRQLDQFTDITLIVDGMQCVPFCRGLRPINLFDERRQLEFKPSTCAWQCTDEWHSVKYQ